MTSVFFLKKILLKAGKIIVRDHRINSTSNKIIPHRYLIMFFESADKAFTLKQPEKIIKPKTKKDRYFC